MGRWKQREFAAAVGRAVRADPDGLDKACLGRTYSRAFRRLRQWAEVVAI